MARIREIDGLTAADFAEEGERSRRARRIFGREVRITYMDELPDDNRIVAGSLWSDPERLEISLEEEYAADLGVGVGSSILFDIQGVPIELEVTSLRSVEWEGFGINFFMIAEPGALDDAPQLRLATAQLPRGREQSVQDRLVREFPNVTLVHVREVLEKVVAMLTRLAWGIRLLGGFTTVAGLAILAGSLGVESRRRAAEVALLKTLGMRKREITSFFAAEYAVIGVAAGLIGALGGGLLSWLVITRVIELDWSFSVLAVVVAVTISALLAAAIGTGATTAARRQRPIEVLRAEG